MSNFQLNDFFLGVRDIYRQEISQLQDFHRTEEEKWSGLQASLNFKLAEKRQECEDNIAYYSQREAELETKIDELMTRLQEQTAAYMKLQSEFDNYEWWDEDDEAAAAAASRRSRESLPRSRPPTRPPTREDVHRFSKVKEKDEEGEEEVDEEEEEEEGGKDCDVEAESKQETIFEPGKAIPHSAQPGISGESKSQGGTAATGSTDLNNEADSPPRRGERAAAALAQDEMRNSWFEAEQTS